MAIPAKFILTIGSYFSLNITMILIGSMLSLVSLYLIFIGLKYSTGIMISWKIGSNYVARVWESFNHLSIFKLGRIGIVLLLPSLAISPLLNKGYSCRSLQF